MKNYIIIDQNSNVLRHGSCNDGSFNAQAQEDETVIEGQIDDINQKVVDKKVVDKTQTELDDYKFKLVENMLPDEIDLNWNDGELDTYLNNYYIQRIDIVQWRIDNYRYLRKMWYPKIEEYTDAQVKLNSGIPELIQQGQEQLNKYIQDCLDIKTRFPKG